MVCFKWLLYCTFCSSRPNPLRPGWYVLLRNIGLSSHILLPLLFPRFAFGKTPGSQAQDPAFNTPCFSLCPTRRREPAGSCHNVEAAD